MNAEVSLRWHYPAFGFHDGQRDFTLLAHVIAITIVIKLIFLAFR